MPHRGRLETAVKITLNIIPEVMSDITEALANTIKQAQDAAERNATSPGRGSWATAEADLIALDVLHEELHKAIYVSKHLSKA